VTLPYSVVGMNILPGAGESTGVTIRFRPRVTRTFNDTAEFSAGAGRVVR